MAGEPVSAPRGPRPLAVGTVGGPHEMSRCDMFDVRGPLREAVLLAPVLGRDQLPGPHQLVLWLRFPLRLVARRARGGERETNEQREYHDPEPSLSTSSDGHRWREMKAGAG